MVQLKCVQVETVQGGAVPGGGVPGGSSVDTDMVKVNLYTSQNTSPEQFRPRSKSDVASRTYKRPNILNQLKIQRKASCANASHRPISPLVQVPLTIQENPKKEEEKQDTGFRPRSKSDAPNFLQRRNPRKSENPSKPEKSTIKEEEQQKADETEEDDLKPEPRKRAATASKAEEPEFRERAASLGQSARARVTSIVRKLRHRSSDSNPADEKKKKIKYYPSSEFVLDAKERNI